MSVFSDLRVLYHLALKPVRGDSHAERMENFYAGQAGAYDDFRRRLLQGREELWSQLIERAQGGVWIDMGGGTGANLEYFGAAIDDFQHVYVVDLSRSLLEVAEQRAAAAGWQHVHTVEADATNFSLPQKADVITFSYSLTMIPDWFAAIDNALAHLNDDGIIGVVDFFVSRKHAETQRQQHSWLTRTGWSTWFANDNVFLSPDHVPFLQRQLRTELLSERRAKVPYIPLARVPYYLFIGRKTMADTDARLVTAASVKPVSPR